MNRLLVGASLVFVVARPAVAQNPSDFFEKSVRPVLVEHCQECHGPNKQKGGLRVDSREALLTGGDSGPALVVGNPAASLLVKALSHREEPRMPPKAPLLPAQAKALADWVKAGAVWPNSGVGIRQAVKAEFEITPKDRQFWSFRPVADPPAPSVKNASWAKGAIDRFVLAKLETAGMEPVESADRRTWIRRVTFDLIGLPPSPEEVSAFLADTAPGAQERVVDRLLQSPHYGERWARHWLDVARYGEDQAHTFQARKYPMGYRYRDWLVKAFNDDMPFDRMIREQIAADLLGDGPDRVEHLPALGFFALGPVYYGDPKRLDQIDDRIDTLTRGLLGLTVACARCHDHKYDPISSKDYYGLAGIVASTDYAELSLAPGKEGKPVAPPPKDKKDPKAPPPAKEPFLHAIKDVAPVTMKVHLRGNPGTLGAEAPKRMMAILAPETAPSFAKGSGRLELADAIADPNNPLTARVFVNRVWRHHFGKGLVRTPSNFGVLGEAPTHPELLDHLTSRFLKSGWSVKALHRDIVLSATYALASRSDAKNDEKDADNRLLWRANRRRLDVESWRDAMLVASAQLDRTMGGPSLDLAAANNRRRTLYGQVSRHELNPLLRLFDFPDPNITCDERTVTTVPLQQLFVLNSEFLVGNAKALAARLKGLGANDEQRIRQAFETLYARPARDDEVALGLAFLQGPPAKTSASAPGMPRWEQYAQALLSANEFLYVD